MWHLRLRHPTFPYLKRLFPSLFKNKNVPKFQCETCELSKYHHTYIRFKIILNQVLFPLFIVMYGVFLVWIQFLVLNGLSYSLMTIPMNLGHIFCKKNQRHKIYFKIFINDWLELKYVFKCHLKIMNFAT